MQDIVNEILDRKVLGRYDLEWYSAFDLYWDVLRHQQVRLAGYAQRDLVTAAQRWLDAQKER